MMRPGPVRFCTVFFAVVFLAVQSAHAQHHFVHRDGRQLKDSTGQTLQLRGVNLGGWLLWEQWIWGGKFKSQTFIEEALTDLVGKTATQKFNENIFDWYITEADIREIGRRGFNVVRIPLNHCLFDTVAPANTYKGRGWILLDHVLQWCKKYQVYAIIDLHAAPGGQSPYFIADPDKANLWKSGTAQQKTIEWWKAVAKRYRNNTTVAGYDLLNEPIPGNEQKLLDLYQNIITAIRQVDPNHLLVLEGTGFAKNFDLFRTLPDANMALSFHVYTWFGGDPLKKVQQHIETSKRLDVPMWCGEWGENNYEVIGKTLKALDDPAAGFAGWCFWTWKKAVVPGKFPALVGIPITENWKKVMNGTHKTLKKLQLNGDDVMKAMDDFSSAAVFKNCIVDETLMRLLTSFKTN